MIICVQFFMISAVSAQEFICDFDAETAGYDFPTEDSIYTEYNQPCFQPSLNICAGFSSNFPYTPMLGSMDPITIRVNFHFMKTGNYGLNFGENNGNASHCDVLNTNNDYWTIESVSQYLLSEVNNKFSGLADYKLHKSNGVIVNPAEPFLDVNDYPVTNLGDSKIRVSLYEEYDEHNQPMGSIFIHEIDSFRYVSNFTSGPCSDNQVVAPYSNWKSNFSKYGSKVLDVFIFDEWFPFESYETFSIDSSGDTTYYDVPCRLGRGIASGSLVSLANLWYLWQQDTCKSSILHGYAGILAHEIGHTLSLGHPWVIPTCCDANEKSHSYKNDTLDQFGVSNNIMGYNPQINAFSPCQINTMHNAAITRSFIDYGENHPLENYCNKQSGFIEIDNGLTVWDDSKIIEKDVIVKSGSRLNIVGNICIGLAKEVIIHVEQGAMLYVENARLRSLCTQQLAPNPNQDVFSRHWGGIKVAGNSSRNHPNHYNDSFNQDGKDPGRVVLINAKIEDARHAISDSWSLIYNPEYWGGFVHAEQSEFRGCHRAAEFMQYRQPNGQANKSKFLGCYFTGYYQTNSQSERRGVGISIWDCKDILIEGCTFDDLDLYAILTVNGSLNIPQLNTFKKIRSTAIQAIQTRPHGFDKNIKIGSASGYPNHFIDNKLDIRIEGYGGLILPSEITNNYFSTTGIFSFASQSKALEAVNQNSLRFEANNITNKLNATSIDNNFNEHSVFHNNIYEDVNIGVHYFGNNQRTTFSCNIFNDYTAGVHLNSTINDQGSDVFSNANRWLRSAPQVGVNDIRTRAGVIDQRGIDPGFSLPSSKSLFTYFVEQSQATYSHYRPLCNLTDLLLCSQSNDYETGNSDDNMNCAPYLPIEEEEDLSIYELGQRIDSIANADTLYKINQEFIQYSSRKYTLIVKNLGTLLTGMDYEEADSLLEAQSEHIYQQLRLGLRLQQGNLNAASALLEDLAIAAVSQQELDYVAVQHHNLKWEEDYTYRPDSTGIEELRAISQTNYEAAGTVARGLMSLWYDDLIDPYFVEVDDPPQQMPEYEFDYPPTVYDAVPTLYPNPGMGEFILHLPTDFTSDNSVELQIVNLSGIPVFNRQLYVPIGGSQHPLDLNHLTSGVYFVLIRANEMHFTTKLMISK